MINETELNNSLDRRAALDLVEQEGIELKKNGADPQKVDEYVNFLKAQAEANERQKQHEKNTMPLSMFDKLTSKERAAYMAKGGQLRND